MAKANESAFLINIDKIVLAVAAVVLLAVGWSKLGSPAYMVEINGSEVAPAQADQELKSFAERVAARTGDAPPPDVLPDFEQGLEVAQNTPLTPRQMVMVDWGQFRPVPEESTIVDMKKLKLADIRQAIPTPGKVLGQAYHELRRGAPDPADVTAFHGASVFDYVKLLTSWDEALGNRVEPVVIVTEVQVQRQELLADGSFGPPQVIKTVSYMGDPAGGRSARGSNRLQDPLAIPDWDGQNTREVEMARNAFIRDGWEEFALEPEYWDILGPTGLWRSWRIHLPETEVTKMYVEATGIEADSSPARPSRPRPLRMPRGQSYPLGGRDDGLMLEYEGGYGEYGAPDGSMLPMDGGRQPAPRAPSAYRPGSTQAPYDEDLPPLAEPTIVPPLATQKQMGKVLAWFHDISLEPTKTYQYRLRVGLFNPLYTHATEVEDAQDANVKTIYSSWSQWSGPVNVPKEAELFLTGSSTSSGEATFTVFSRAHGHAVSERFSVAVGEKIGQQKTLQVPDPDAPDPDNPPMLDTTVNFETGAVLVAIDFGKTVYQRGIPVTTTQVTLLDEKGRLFTRVRDIDLKSDRFKELEEWVNRGRGNMAELIRRQRLIELRRQREEEREQEIRNRPTMPPGGPTSPYGPYGPGGDLMEEPEGRRY